MAKFKLFLKNEIVLIVSLILAIGSSFFVKPTIEYFEYIDFKTLVQLFCLMAVMAGLKAMGVFTYCAKALLSKVSNTRQLYLLLTLLCFISSMLITNDVALITMVPFTLVTLNLAKQRSKSIIIIVMETIAANLGSMLTPVGNPQNLYLFSTYNMSFKDFIVTIIPYWALSLLLLLSCSFKIKKEPIVVTNDKKKEFNYLNIAVYFILFILSILCVFRVIPFYILFGIVVLSILIFDKSCIKRIDYSLLFTFVFLFIFIGNLGNISSISNYLMKVVNSNEVLTGIISSQVFSNVPACILLSKFTNNANSLLIGVNLGGLGTLIASMASLISYKFIKKEEINAKKYLLVFTILNVFFLFANYSLYLILNK